MTLAGGANSTSFLCLIGLSVFYFFKTKNIKRKSFIYNNEIIGGLFFLLFSIASLLSMSRSAFLTLFFVILYVLKKKFLSLRLIAPLIIFSIVVAKTNLLEYVNYSRITKSISTVSGEKSFGHSEQERVDAYTKPFEFLIEYPVMLILGKGLSNYKVSKSNKYGYYEKETKGRHGLLGSITYDRGFLAFLIFLIFIFKLYKTSFFNSSSQYKFLKK